VPFYRLRILRDGSILSSQVTVADKPFRRMVGLLGRQSLKEDESLLISPCTAIHTCFMRFPIDAVFLTRELEIVNLHANLPPWRLALGGKGSFCVLELPAGKAARVGLKRGDRLLLEECPNGSASR